MLFHCACLASRATVALISSRRVFQLRRLRGVGAATAAAAPRGSRSPPAAATLFLHLAVDVQVLLSLALLKLAHRLLGLVRGAASAISPRVSARNSTCLTACLAALASFWADSSFIPRVLGLLVDDPTAPSSTSQRTRTASLDLVSWYHHWPCSA
jgi:hypothetical protein